MLWWSGVADSSHLNISGGVADASHPNGLWPATARMSCSSFCSGGGVADASHLNIMCAQVRVALPSISDVVNQVCPAEKKQTVLMDHHYHHEPFGAKRIQHLCANVAKDGRCQRHRHCQRFFPLPTPRRWGR